PRWAGVSSVFVPKVTTVSTISCTSILPFSRSCVRFGWFVNACFLSSILLVLLMIWALISLSIFVKLQVFAAFDRRA
ncbi:hypothetical protein QE152_g41300, partial [Popillia japonica]